MIVCISCDLECVSTSMTAAPLPCTLTTAPETSQGSIPCSFIVSPFHRRAQHWFHRVSGHCPLGFTPTSFGLVTTGGNNFLPTITCPSSYQRTSPLSINLQNFGAFLRFTTLTSVPSSMLIALRKSTLQQTNVTEVYSS